MLQKTITYTDYNGVERTESYHFNLNKAEIMQMEMSISGGLTAKINRVVESQDAPEIMEIFKDLLLRSYGVKSDDGKRFIKNAKLREEFEQTEAYSILFMELATDPDAAAKFVNGIIPADTAAELVKNGATHPALK